MYMVPVGNVDKVQSSQLLDDSFQQNLKKYEAYNLVACEESAVWKAWV